MTSIDSIDSAAILSTIPHDMLQVLAGVRHIMETSLAQDSKLLDIISILATQAEQIKERDQSIMIMQSKIDSQQAIIEEIRAEQRLLISNVAALSQCQEHTPDDSVTLSPPDIRETPEPATHSTATPEKSGTSPTILVLEQSASKRTPNHASNALSDTTDAAAVHVNPGITPTDDAWRIPECYAKTQRGTRLRRHGAFYGTPDWHAMTVASGGVPDSGAPPPAPPTRSTTQEEIILALANARADVKRKLEARKKDAAAIAAEAAASDDGNIASESDASHRSSYKRCREPDEQEARRSPNPMDISSIVNGALDEGSPPLLSLSSSGPCSVQDNGSNSDGHAKRRRLSTDEVESPADPERKRPTRRSPRRESN